MAARKPLNFNLDAAPVPPPASAPAPEKEERQQVGARIRKTSYRRLKARAAMEGRKVQDLVELAVEKLLAEPSN